MNTCPYCAGEMPANRRAQCGSAECARQHRNRRMREYFARYKEAHGVDYLESRYGVNKECQDCGTVVRSRHASTRCGACARRANGAKAADAHRVAAEARRVERESARLPVVRRTRDRKLTRRWVTATAALHASPCPANRRFASGRCLWCAEEFTAVFYSEDVPRYCSAKCSRAFNKQKRGRFLVPPRVRQAIYTRDNWVCQLCNESVDPTLPPSHAWAATLDHIECQAWTEVPNHSPDNLRLAHRMCNSVRGDETYGKAA